MENYVCTCKLNVLMRLFIVNNKSNLNTGFGAVGIFTFPLLKVNWTFRGKGVRQWTLVWGIFKQKKTDAFS